MKNGGSSLVLDYTVNGVRHREKLGLYLVPEKTRIDRMRNQETMKMAQVKKAQRALDIEAGNVGMTAPSAKKMCICDYMEQRSDYYRKRGSGNYAQTVLNCLHYVRSYQGNILISKINEAYLIGFIDYLNESDLGDGSIYTYFQCLLIVINSAVRARIIFENPSRHIDAALKPKQKESTREYLTIEELRLLAETPCLVPVVKNAFLFSCFSGLRISDVRTLDWSQIHGDRIEKRTQKKGAVIYTPLSPSAKRFMGRACRSGLVFPDIPQSPTLERILGRWAGAAGMTKHVTFHVSRHTNATMLLTYGADIYTVSQLLGHRNVSTTQIYAKIIDRKKSEAVDKLPEI